MFSFFLGLAILALYAGFVCPPGMPRGYLEDFCNESSLNVMTHQLQQTGLPGFTTDRFMAPFGMSVPYFSWSLERDWFGSYVYLWDKNFPILVAYFVISFLLSYLIVGGILTRMLEKKFLTWLLATFFLIFHVARHFKFWHHYEYVTQHWVYSSLFLDAWIWQKLIRKKQWDINLEIWRGFCLVGVLTGPGYFFGPMYLEWILVHLCLVSVLILRHRRGIQTSILWTFQKNILPILLSLFLFILECLWFPPLLAEMKKVGQVPQGLGYPAHFFQILRPFWIDPILAWLQLSPLPSFNNPETVVTLGWVYWVPVILGVSALRKSKGGAGIITVLPFLLLMGIALGYATLGGEPWTFQHAIQTIMPPMQFFRVCCRWGAFMPQIAAVILVLAWPELMQRVSQLWKAQRIWVYGFIVLSILEITPLLHPVHGQLPLDASTQRLLETLKTAPGTTVLDLPFCVAGGNGVCIDLQCPQYPKSTMGQCLSGWHDKKVYGLYQGRLAFEQCRIYGQTPYSHWFEAWKEDRCLTVEEWGEFCQYLKTHPELSAILLYPEIWTATGSCLSDFAKHLGSPMDESTYAQEDGSTGRLLRYAPRCTEEVPR